MVGLEGVAHLEGRAGGPRRVALAVEHQEQGIASEVEQIAAVEHGHVEQLGEGAVENARHLLGADLPLSGQLVGEPGEA